MSDNKYDAVVNIRCIECKVGNQIKCNQVDWEEWQGAKRRRMIQDIFPYLPASDRELMMSGMCEVCYDHIFAVKDEITGEK